MKPTGKNLLIQTIEVNQTTSSGIIVSPMSAPKGMLEEFATVLAVGPEVTLAKVGDTVYFKEYNVDRIQTGNFADPDTHTFLDEKFILAVEKK